jgi:hypothetical protein
MRAPAVKDWSVHRVHFPNPIFCSHDDDTVLSPRAVGSQWGPIRHTLLACLKFTSRHGCHVRTACHMTQCLWETDVITGVYSAATDAFPFSCHLRVCELQFPVSSN